MINIDIKLLNKSTLNIRKLTNGKNILKSELNEISLSLIHVCVCFWEIQQGTTVVVNFKELEFNN